MSKGKFEPGKSVLLLRSERQNPKTEHLVNTQQTITRKIAQDFDFRRNCPRWELANVRVLCGVLVAWSQKCMIIIDPDETPEQSIEAMRLLYDINVPDKINKEKI